MSNSPNHGSGRVEKYEVNGKVLTKCQARIISLSIHGLQRKQLAHLLGNSHHTIDTHLDRIYKLLGMQDARQVVAWAIRHGFDFTGGLNEHYLFDNRHGMPWTE